MGILFSLTACIVGLLILLRSPPFLVDKVGKHGFSFKEATVSDFQLAFRSSQLTSRQLVEVYLAEIKKLNPLLKGVIEVNPEAIYLAEKADRERKNKSPEFLSDLHGIPILLKDNIASRDKLNTTAGSLALLGSVVAQDAGVVRKLREAGAIILGKASLTEWANFRSFDSPSGWCARSGHGKNPYALSAIPCGSSSGSAISVAANMVAVSLGTETDGSILCPSSYNSVVGIKPTVGLTSRSGVVPITLRQDSVGPICRTVSDAVTVLEAIVGFDKEDDETLKASKLIPAGGYKQFLDKEGLRGKRIGIVRNPFFSFGHRSILEKMFEDHFKTLREKGAVLVDQLEIKNIDIILDSMESGERTAMLSEFKTDLNAYLKKLVVSPIRSLADVIAFNDKHMNSEMIGEYGQGVFLDAQATNGIGEKEKEALRKMGRLTRDGFESLVMEKKLDAIVTPGANVAPVLGIGGFPGISVPAGYDETGVPIGICFGGLKGSEPKLIQIAYGFEQATKIRKPPSFIASYGDSKDFIF